VDFDDWLQTTLYLHPDTGALVTRRHRLWRWYDFQWMLHIMDYGDRETPTASCRAWRLCSARLRS
jgi:hypothetical protein